MNIYLIICIILVFISISLLLYFSSYAKLKEYKIKIDNAESIIDENLNKKLDIIISLNGEIKNVTNKKDYLKDYVQIRDYIMTNIEKDLKLEEAVKLIDNLNNDFDELSKDKEYINNYKEIRAIDEILISAKKIFNQNAYASNQLIKSFPNNIVAKLNKIKLRSFYNIKTDEVDTF